MTDSDKANFRDLIVGSANTLGQYIDPAALKFWWSDLKRYDLKDVELAFESFRKDASAKMPTIGQVIFEIAKRNRKPYELHGEREPIPDGVIHDILKRIEADAPKDNNLIIGTPLNDDAPKETFQIIGDILKQENEGK